MNIKPSLLVTIGLLITVSSLGIYFYQQNADLLAELLHSVPEKVVCLIDNGDLANPKLSPDGRFLAYSRVLVKNGEGKATDYTEVLIKDIVTGEDRKLFDQEASKDYTYFAASVSNIEWLNDWELVVTIADGDLRFSALTYEIETGKLLKTEFFLNSGIDPTISPRKQALYYWVVKLFPEFDKEFLENSIRQYAFEIPNRGVVLQKNCVGYDQDIWFLDYETKHITKLLAVKQGELRGGFAHGDAIVFLIGDNHQATVYRYENYETYSLFKSTTKLQYGSLSVKHQTPERVVFMIRANASYEEGDNPLLIYDGHRVIKLGKYARNYDVDVDAKGERIAFCYWEKGKRKIAVKDLELVR